MSKDQLKKILKKEAAFIGKAVELKFENFEKDDFDPLEDVFELMESGDLKGNEAFSKIDILKEALENSSLPQSGEQRRIPSAAFAERIQELRGIGMIEEYERIKGL